MFKPTTLAVLTAMGAALTVPADATAASPAERRAGYIIENLFAQRIPNPYEQRVEIPAERMAPPERRAVRTSQALTITGPSFEVPVSDNPSTGYTVALQSASRGIFLVDVTTESPARPMPGAPSRKVFRFFSTLGPGSSGQIVFVRFQSFNFGNTVSTETYEVRRR
jgi:hypothetical protein